MDFAMTILQIVIGVMVTLILLIITDIRHEIKAMRQRLHFLEGQEKTATAHFNVFHQWLGEARDIVKRLTILEAKSN